MPSLDILVSLPASQPDGEGKGSARSPTDKNLVVMFNVSRTTKSNGGTTFSVLKKSIASLL